MVTPAAKGSSELRRVQLPFASQVYMGRPSLRTAVIVAFAPVAVAVPTTTVAAQLLSAVAVWLDGQVIVVFEVSSTVIVKVQLPPPVSEVPVTTVVPTGKNEPEGGVDVIDPQVPVPTGSGYVTCFPRCPPSVVSALVVMSLGQVSVQVPAPAAASVWN